MVSTGLRTRPSMPQRIAMMLKRETTGAQNKRGTNSTEKSGNRRPKKISLAPIKGASHEPVNED